MLFNSLEFLYLFLPVTFGVFWTLKRKNARYAWLTLTGYVFYSAWDWRFCGLMAFSTLASYLAGLGMLRWSSPGARRACLVVPIGVDLLLLGFFKYADFAIESVNAASGWLGSPADLAPLKIILPVGISFYTFHTISYIVDCWRGTVKPTRNLLEFGCYVSLFSQLVAGPIVRFREIEEDLERIDASRWKDGLDTGFSWFCIGLAKKVLLADSIARIVDPALASYSTLGTLDAWACMIGYSFQLYFDFSGYSDMAVGLGRLFGIRIPKNFTSPYKALDLADFWRRWHISLSSCLRDYLYIPFGGNRGSALRTSGNLLATMLIGGLWHGAAWTFVLWGAYHGLLLVLHRAVAGPWGRLPAVLRRAATFVLVVGGWVLFRSADLPMALALYKAMFLWAPGAGFEAAGTLWALLAAGGLVVWGLPNTHELSHAWRPAARWGLGISYAACLLVIFSGQASPFLYFQF